MSNMQKIVVLCVVAGISAGGFFLYRNADEPDATEDIETNEPVVTEDVETEFVAVNNEETETTKTETMGNEPVVTEDAETEFVAVNNEETETTKTETMGSEPQENLSCRTGGGSTYTLDTDGNHAYGYYVPSTSDSSVLEWSIEVEEIPSDNSYWFFAFNFVMDGTFRSEQPQVGGYAGFQTDGQDHLTIFSVWGADTSEGSGGLSAAEIYEDGSVNRILGEYPWQVGQKYNFRLVKNPESMVLYINDSKVGTHYLPADYPDNFYSRISLFVEWFGVSKANFPVCVSFSDFSPSPASLYPGTSSQENLLNFNIDKLGDTIKFSR